MSESQTTGQPPVQTKGQQLLHECEKHFADSMVLGWAGVIEGSVEKLYSEAETSGDADVQIRCHAAARILSRNKERQRNRLRLGIGALFFNPDESPRAPPRRKVDQDEVQALETVINSVELLFSNDLRALKMRLSVLASDRTFDDATNPSGPRAFCRLMADGIEELELTSPDRVIVYGQAIRPLLQAFTRAYQWMNDHLAKAGVLPHIKLRSRPLQAAARGQSPSSQQTEEDRNESEAVMDCVHTLMDRIHHRVVTPESALELQELDAILADLQKRTVPTTSRQVRESLLSLLGAEEKPVNPVHIHTIDLMGMVQDHVEEQIQASSAVKSIFAQLQLPLIRVALAESAFFQDPEHPARQLLKAVTEACEMWADDASELEEMWAIMKSAVSDVVVQYDGDSSVFFDLVFELANHVQQIRDRVRASEKRHIAARQGQERLALARLAASQCISELIEKYNSPMFSRTLLQKGWFDYLALCYLRGGEQDPDFAEAVSTARFMAIAGSGKASKQLAGRLLNKLPAVGDVVSKGLPETSFSQSTVDGVILHFRQTLEWSRDHEPGATPPDWLGEEFAPGTLVSPESEAALKRTGTPAESNLNTALSRQMKQLRGTTFGTWFRLRDSEGNDKHYKLSWMGPLSGQCLMIRPLGGTWDMALVDLAQQLVSKTGERLTEQHLPAFDRALRLVRRRLEKIVGVREGNRKAEG